MEILEDFEFFLFELSRSISSLDTTQWGFIVFSIMVFVGITWTIAPKTKGRTESFRDTIFHDKRSLIGLFVVLPIFVIGYIWAFTLIF
jgi:hypothetical protein